MIATGRPVVWTGIGLITAIGLIHLNGAPDSFGDATYKGLLFVANGLGAAVAAVGLYKGARRWAWGLGIAVAGGAFLAYVMSRTIGLPGLEAEPDAWFEPLGVLSLLAEASFVALASYRLLRGLQGEASTAPQGSSSPNRNFSDPAS